jgi:Cu+-exporting ATPase
MNIKLDNSEIPSSSRSDIDIQHQEQDTKLVCAHCGLDCRDDSISINDKVFCCNGCKKVYELLHSSEMCAYYNLDENAGVTPSVDETGLKYGYLEDADIRSQLIEFSDGGISRISFNIPSMHCASCIWLLEQLNRLHSGVTNSRVNFLKHELTVTFKEDILSLRQLVELLASLGYEPDIRLEDIKKKEREDSRKRLYIQIGYAGFAFGNIMLLSFPEYLTRAGDTVDPGLKNLFMWINFVLAIPVIFYSGLDYLIGAYKGLRHKVINLDVPISLGILALFGRSAYEIIAGVGPGYFDSLAGLIFLLLIGKLFQAKTYETLSFERDYTSYFPIAVIRYEEGVEKSVPVMSLVPGDRIIIRNQELIPADSVLIEGDGGIDYSFVTGESEPVKKESGDVVYAGGRQIGEAIELEVIEEVSRSYLTRLWNHDSFTHNNEVNTTTLANTISKYFVAAVLAIAVISFVAHSMTNVALAFHVFTAVLIVACPCALALATPFTLGTAMRLLGRKMFYLKNTDVLEKMSKVTHVVFDKTGTLTHPGNANINWVGHPLSKDHKVAIKSLIRHSTHPVSIKLNSLLRDVSAIEIADYEELPGKGILGNVDNKRIKLGSWDFIVTNNHNPMPDSITKGSRSGTFIEINNEIIGYFELNTILRKDTDDLVKSLKDKYTLSLLSGDTSRDEVLLKSVFPADTQMHFEQSPEQKLKYIETLQKNGEKVLMIGDGLNDAGALQKSDVGIALTDDITAFSPACDALLDAKSLPKLDTFLKFSKIGVRIIIAGFALSFAYNIIRLSFAVMGKLSPLVSAILMPVSSITVVAYSTFATKLEAHFNGLRS